MDWTGEAEGCVLIYVVRAVGGYRQDACATLAVADFIEAVGGVPFGGGFCTVARRDHFASAVVARPYSKSNFSGIFS